MSALKNGSVTPKKLLGATLTENTERRAQKEVLN